MNIAWKLDTVEDVTRRNARNTDFYRKKEKSNMHVYMAVTKDKYELPLAIADTSVELAKLMNTTDTVVRSCVYQEKRGTRKRSMYKKVQIDNFEDEDE